MENSHSWGKTEVRDDLGLPESLRQMTCCAHPKNEGEYQHDGQSVDNATICVTMTMLFNLSVLPLFLKWSLWTILSLRLHSILKTYKSKSFGLKCSKEPRTHLEIHYILCQASVLLTLFPSLHPHFLSHLFF